MKRAPIAMALLLCLVAGGLAGCAGAVVGAAATGATAAAQERGFDGAVSDTAIRAEINRLWFDHDVKLMTDIGLSVVEGRVLLTGKVPTQAARVDAVRLAWKPAGVKEVINEIKVTNEGSIGNYARDSWISTQLRAKLLVDSDVYSINYSIDTVDGVVFLMGIAQNSKELSRVTNYASNLDYVKKVVSYVRLKDDPRRKNP